MTTFAALPAQPARRLRLARGITLLSILIVATLGALLLAGPASAIVTEVGATKAGLSPRNVKAPIDGDGATAASFENAAGNPVVHGSDVYVIYWDPAINDPYHGDWQQHINNFMAQVGSESGSLGNVFAVNTQYTDRSNVPASYSLTYRGSPNDTTPYPPAGCSDPAAPSALACLTDKQVQEQLQTFIAQHGLPKGMGVIYYLLTPPGVSICLDAAGTRCSDYLTSAEEAENKEFTNLEKSFCSYHSDINPDAVATGDANTILYGVIPWSATTLTGGLAYECQDGGYNPKGKKFPEEPEKAPERTKKEQEAFNEGNATEKAEILAKEKHEGPHIEEPNQSGLGPDGTYDTALSDVIINQIALEQENIVTDPLLNGWQDSAHNEATDECRDWFAAGSIGGSVSPDEHTLAGTLSNQTIGGHTYYLQMAFNLAALKLTYPGVPCIGGANLIPSFTAPNVVNPGDIVNFDGMESDIDLNAGIDFSGLGAPKANYATYTWNFGDGTPVVSGFAPGAPVCEAPWLSPCAASVFHSYAHGGTYEVTLTATDIGGHTASVTHPVVVTGPSGSGAGSTAPGGPSTSPGTVSPGAKPLPAPVAVASVVSRSLRGTLKKGLVVRYSVNEQVAGHFEVLLARSLARRLKIGGSPATGLPAGTPPQLVIAKAVLITTKGGHSTVAIKFSKTVAKRLSQTHKVSLLLRLIVRNAASKSPLSTTVLSSVTLAG